MYGCTTRAGDTSGNGAVAATKEDSETKSQEGAYAQEDAQTQENAHPTGSKGNERAQTQNTEGQ